MTENLAGNESIIKMKRVKKQAKEKQHTVVKQ